MDPLVLAPRAGESAEAGQGQEDGSEGPWQRDSNVGGTGCRGSASSRSHHATEDTEMFSTEAGICPGPPWEHRAQSLLFLPFSCSKTHAG